MTTSIFNEEMTAQSGLKTWLDYDDEGNYIGFHQSAVENDPAFAIEEPTQP